MGGSAQVDPVRIDSRYSGELTLATATSGCSLAATTLLVGLFACLYGSSADRNMDPLTKLFPTGESV
jgi:hypothetical protein